MRPAALRDQPAIEPGAAAVPFAAFYDREWRPVMALAWSLAGDRQVAEELAQDAFLDAYRRWEEIGRYQRPDAWVRRAVANQAVSVHRRRRTERDGLQRLGTEPLAAPQLPPDDESFWSAVRWLPERQAVCVALHYLEDRSVREIAAVLECSASTVKVHLHRGRRALANRLGIRVTLDEELR